MDKTIENVVEIQQTVTENDIAKIGGWAVRFYLQNRNGYVFTPESFTDKSFEEFMLNPIMLFNHNEDKPIGRVTNIEIRDDGLWVDAEITDKEIAEKIKNKTLNTMSIHGFANIDSEGNIKNFKLLEISVVSIPADPYATIEVIQKVPAIHNNPYVLDEEWDWDWVEDANKIIEKLGWEGLARACAWYETDKDGKPLQKKEAYKLPHHKLVNGELVLHYGGVVAALRRLPLADIPNSEKDKVKEHLQKHLLFLKQKKEEIDMEKIEQKLNKLEKMVYELKEAKREVKQEIKEDAIIDSIRVKIAQKLNKDVKPVYEIKQAITTEDTSAGVYILPTMEQKLVKTFADVSDLFKQVQIKETKSPKVLVPYVSFNTTDPYTPMYANRWVDGTPITAHSDPVMTTKLVEVQPLASIFKHSQLALEDLPNFINLVDVMMEQFGYEIGNTIAKEIADDLKNNSPVVTLGGAPTLDDLAKQLFDLMYKTKIKDYVWVMNSNNAYTYLTTKDGNGNYMFGGPVSSVEMRIWDKPVVISNELADNEIILMSRQDIVIYRVQGIKMDTGYDSNDFASGLIAYRLLARMQHFNIRHFNHLKLTW